VREVLIFSFSYEAAIVEKIIREPEKFNQHCLELAGDEQTVYFIELLNRVIEVWE
jgi:hypothetical protein